MNEKCKCPGYKSVYECARCDEQRCLDCGGLTESNEIKSIAKWCPACSAACEAVGREGAPSHVCLEPACPSCSRGWGGKLYTWDRPCPNSPAALRAKETT